MSSQPAPGPSSVLRGHRAEVQALCYHPNRRLLYSGDSLGEAKAWDLQTERAIWSQRLHPAEAGVTAIHIAGADCSTLLSQGRNGTIIQWAMSAEGLPSRNPLQLIETGSYNFCRMAVFSLDPHIFQALTTINPKLTSQQTHEAFLNQNKGPQQSGSTIDGTEKLCSPSAEPGQQHRNAANEEPAVDVTETTRQKSIVAIAGHDPAVLEIWSVTTGTIIQHLTQPAESKHGMCMAVQLYMHSGQHTLHALVGYEDGTVAVWDVATGSLLASKQLHAEPVMAVAVAADGSGGICAAADNKVQCFCLGPTSTLLTVLATLEVKQQGIADICIRPDQRLFATAGWDGKVRLFHHKKMRPLAILQLWKPLPSAAIATSSVVMQYHRKGVTALVFQPHNQCLVSASRDGTIAMWSVFQRETP